MRILIEQLVRYGRSEGEITRLSGGRPVSPNRADVCGSRASVPACADAEGRRAAVSATAALQFDQAASSATSASTGLAVAVTRRDSVSAAARTAPAAAIAART
jgi:hypothetical protein